jgi:ABC-type sugar transport system substrate-binding protein
VNHLRAEFSDLPIFAVAADQTEIGRIQGKQLLERLPRGSELVYLQGPIGTSSAIRRYAGLREVLQGISLDVFTLNSDWTRARRRPRVAGLGARLSRAVSCRRSSSERKTISWPWARETPSRSWRRSVRSSPVSSVSFCGCDGSPSYGQRLVIEGKLAATVIMPLCAGRAIAEIASMLRGGPLPPATIELQPEPFP